MQLSAARAQRCGAFYPGSMAAEWGELGGQTFGFLGVGTAPGADVHEAKIQL